MANLLKLLGKVPAELALACPRPLTSPDIQFPLTMSSDPSAWNANKVVEEKDRNVFFLVSLSSSDRNQKIIFKTQ